MTPAESRPCSPATVRVKVCCISSLAEARAAVGYGASALGLVSAMPSGPGCIEESLIAEIAGQVPPPVATFLLTAHQEPGAIVDQHRICRTTTIQFVDRLDKAAYAVLRRHLPGIGLVQVIHVRDKGAVQHALGIAPLVDALLLDSGNPSLAVKELGGTGRVHDWSISRQICQESPRPVFLAGGLHPGNVAEAVRIVRPFGVDLCTGIRTEGKLDGAKLSRFMNAAVGVSMPRKCP